MLDWLHVLVSLTDVGLDAKKYSHTSISRLEEDNLHTLDSQLTDSERFKNAEKWNINCNRCNHEYEFPGVVVIEGDRQFSGFECLNVECRSFISNKSLMVQLIACMHKYLERYLDQSAICDDSTCRIRTRNVGVYGRKCLQPKCKGLMNLEVYRINIVF